MKRLSFLILILVACLMPTSVFGQTAATAKISGTVTDQTGARVRGATVTLVNKKTNAEKNSTTNDDGVFAFALVDPEVYEVKVSSPGFSTKIVTDVEAEVGKALDLSVSLQPGGVTESITVSATNDAILQTDDAAVGNTLSGVRIKRLPNITRSITGLIELQPGTAPGGETTGARADQNTVNMDGLDVSDNVGYRRSNGMVVPIPAEGVEQFGVVVSGANASFGRSAGSQTVITSKRGGNDFHGSVYEYHLNDNLAANSWSNNRIGLRRPELKDNQFGASFGGPILRDKLFFFGLFEGRRGPSPRVSTNPGFTVPTQSFRDGFIKFRDATGAVITIDPRTATICGAAGNAACDPRGLGQSPAIRQQLNRLPLPNEAGGDGLNSGVFRATLANKIIENYGSLRFDYQINSEWALNARGWLFTREQPFGQVDLVNLKYGDLLKDGQKNFIVSLTGTPRSNLVNEFRVGHSFDHFKANQTPLTTSFAGTNLPINLLSFAEPVGLTNIQSLAAGTTEIFDNLTWIKGGHTFQFGANARFLTMFHDRSDKLSALVTQIAFVGDGANVTIPASQRPRPCAGAVTTNCLPASQNATYSAFFATQLGLVDNSSFVAVRDASLQPLPPGTQLITDSKYKYFEFYGFDTWKVSPSFTLSLGLQWQFNTIPKEALGRETVLIERDSRALLDYRNYLNLRQTEAEAGRIHNPALAFWPVKDAGRGGVFNIDYGNISPRIAAAWQPSFKNGFLGRVFGDRRTVLRGGFALVYDRLNTVSSSVIQVVGSGFAQQLTTAGPLIGGNPFRAGVDGPIPLPPANVAQTSPIVPRTNFGFTTNFGETLALALDPNIKTPQNFTFDFTVQRELPGNLTMEVGYLGRLGRKLYMDLDLNSVPYMFKDPASGQTFAQAFDAIGQILRANPAAAVPDQPFFNNQLSGLGAVFGLPTFSGTQAFLQLLGTGPFFASGDVSLIWNLFADGARDFLGRPAFNNRQIGGIVIRTNEGKSDYHAMFVTVRKRFSQGLTFDANYTLSKSDDTLGQIQNFVNAATTSFFPLVDYGPSLFDRRHTFNINGSYDLPFGKGKRFSTGNWVDRIIGGWYTAGIFTANSGVPLIVFQGTVGGAGGTGFGGGIFTAGGAGAIAINPNLNPGNNVNTGVAGSGTIGTNGNPATGGSGLSLFADPAAVFNNFRPALLTSDTRTGRGELRGFNRYNVDFSLGKQINFGERVKLTLTGDFFNLFNMVSFNNPTLNTAQPQSFGVITGAGVARRVQVGARFEF